MFTENDATADPPPCSKPLVRGQRPEHLKRKIGEVYTYTDVDRRHVLRGAETAVILPT